MSRLTKDELLSKITDKIENEDLAIEFLEDVSDSFDNGDEIKRLNEELEASNKKYEDLQTKYKERFMNSVVKYEEPVEIEETKNYIDIREI